MTSVRRLPSLAGRGLATVKCQDEIESGNLTQDFLYTGGSNENTPEEQIICAQIFRRCRWSEDPTSFTGTAKALKEHPRLNALQEEEQVQLMNRIVCHSFEVRYCL